MTSKMRKKNQFLINSFPCLINIKFEIKGMSCYSLLLNGPLYFEYSSSLFYYSSPLAHSSSYPNLVKLQIHQNLY